VTAEPYIGLSSALVLADEEYALLRRLSVFS
jgi:hypothetical protein